MAEIEFLSHKKGTPPLLLLDDMTAELDSSRIAHLLNYLTSRQLQVFITTTDPATVILPADIPCMAFHIVAGNLEQ
jgi:DNA replication and repair protein RecF